MNISVSSSEVTWRRSNELGELGDGQEGGVFEVGGTGHGRAGAHGIGSRDGGGHGVGMLDIEVERERDAVVEVGFADRSVLPAAAVDDLEHLLALGGAEVEVQQGFGGGDFGGGDGGFLVGHGRVPLGLLDSCYCKGKYFFVQ